MAVSALLSLTAGAAHLTLPEVWKAFISGPGSGSAQRIFWYVRLPRTCATLLAGAGLAVSGAMIQSVLANQLASPGIIGVNAGAGLAVTAVCAMGVMNGIVISLSAFLGAMTAVMVVVIAAQKMSASRTTVILGGVAVSTFLTALTDALITLFPDATFGGTDFKVGGFSSISTARLLPAAILIMIGLILALTLTNELDLLSLGEETAHGLGMKVPVMRTLLLGLAALLAGASVSFAGLLGFVGLIVPHMVRRFVGDESRRVLPLCILFGSGFVTICDLASRVLFAPYELPTGILLSVIGGPFFIYLLLHNRKGVHNS